MMFLCFFMFFMIFYDVFMIFLCPKISRNYLSFQRLLGEQNSREFFSTVTSLGFRVC